MLVNKGVHACRLGYDVCSTAHIRLKSSANDSRVADLRFPLSKNPVDIWNVHESTLMWEQWSVPDCRSLSPVSVDTNWRLTLQHCLSVIQGLIFSIHDGGTFTHVPPPSGYTHLSKGQEWLITEVQSSELISYLYVSCCSCYSGWETLFKNIMRAPFWIRLGWPMASATNSGPRESLFVNV